MSIEYSSKLAGQHALITGGSSGIGLAIAQNLLGHGARVTLAARQESGLQTARQALAAKLKSSFAQQFPGQQSAFEENFQGKLQSILMDVCHVESVQQGFVQASENFGAVSILINSAGRAESAGFMKTDAQLWQAMLELNLTGTYHCIQQVLPAMLAQSYGRIVNIVSSAGLKGYPYVSAYCAAKHGVIGLTKALALEVAERGVTVNAVCPGYTETPMLEQAVSLISAKTGQAIEDIKQQLAQDNPQKRLIQVHEVANAVFCLCLPQSSAINGQSIAVADGASWNTHQKLSNGSIETVLSF